ncbi:MAG: hypothetical protein ACRDYX_13685 [Egibacteraceae bacterium]
MSKARRSTPPAAEVVPDPKSGKRPVLFGAQAAERLHALPPEKFHPIIERLKRGLDEAEAAPLSIPGVEHQYFGVLPVEGGPAIVFRQLSREEAQAGGVADGYHVMTLIEEASYKALTGRSRGLVSEFLDSPVGQAFATGFLLGKSVAAFEERSAHKAS